MFGNPHNLNEGKLHGAQENDFHYWLGCAYEMLGYNALALNYWELAKDGNSEPAAAIFIMIKNQIRFIIRDLH